MKAVRLIMFAAAFVWAGLELAEAQNPAANTLPSNAGQVWREYDIRAYVQRVEGIDEPQQTVIDWILRDTGTDTWFREPFGILHANEQSVRVYHTPAVQAKVAEVVERLVKPNDSRAQGVSVHLVTVSSPNWRSLGLPMMRSVPTQNPGVDAWLATREQASLIASQLRARPDFVEHNSSAVTILNGQSHTISRTIPRTFAKSVSPSSLGTFQTQLGEIKEGFQLTISPLATLDGNGMDVVVQCQANQLEKLVPVSVQLPQPARGTVSIEVPQVASWRIYERFRWPHEDVLVISRSVLAMPGNRRPGLDNLPAMLTSRSSRAEAILMLEIRSAVAGRKATRDSDRRASRLNYHGRY